LFIGEMGKAGCFRSPKKIATRKNYYSMLRDDGSLDDSVEHMPASEPSKRQV